MVDKERLHKVIESYLEENSLFLVEVTERGGDNLIVTIDSINSVTLEQCGAINQIVREWLDEESLDYIITVTSAGLTTPFKIFEQYQKYLNREVEVVTKGGEKFSALLVDATEEEIEVERKVRVSVEVKKRKESKVIRERLPLAEIKSTKPYIKI